MGNHSEIRREATEVAVLKLRPPRNPAKERAPWITESMVAGIGNDGKVTGYESGGDHKGTFYREFEGTTRYLDEDFVRVVIYGDETFDIETRIPAAHFRTLVDASAAVEIERLREVLKILADQHSGKIGSTQRSDFMATLAAAALGPNT